MLYTHNNKATVCQHFYRNTSLHGFRTGLYNVRGGLGVHQLTKMTFLFSWNIVICFDYNPVRVKCREVYICCLF